MKKVGIITINDYQNYGNRLQNYATQEVIKSLGFSVETIVNEPNKIIPTRKKYEFIKHINKLKNKPYEEIFSKVNDKISKKLFKSYTLQRIEVFKEFTKSHLLETNYTISEGNIPSKLSSEFDYFITGSDQVWNPHFRNGSSVDFLNFAPKEKRIAYAPSFGIAEIPGDYIINYKKWLSEMHRLSVREKAGAKIIKDLTGRDAQVMVDPTLMLSKEKWLSISSSPKNKPSQPYLLTYFLGNKTKKLRAEICNIAKEKNLKIINLVDISDKGTYIGGPSEFIDLINSASVFCTDSFHGVIFSMLMETPFVVFERAGSLPSMNSRIETLLSTFKLESRLSKNIKNNDQVFNIDYSHIGPILENERNKALVYLKEALQARETQDVLAKTN